MSKLGYINGDIQGYKTISLTELEPETLGTDVLTDGGLEVWTDPNTPTSWIVGTGGEPGTETLTQGSGVENVYEGTYSAKFTTDAGTNSGKYIAQQLTGLTEGDNYRLKFWAKESTETATVQYLALNGDLGVATQVYNFTTSAWVNGTGAGGVVDPMTDIGPDNFETLTMTSAFAEKVGSDVSIPTGGTIVPVLSVQGDGGVSLTLYLDKISFQKVTAAVPKIVHDFTSSNDASEYSAADKVFSFHTTGGSAEEQFGMTGNGVFTTDNSTFNFGSKDIETGGDVFAENGNFNGNVSCDRILSGGLTIVSYKISLGNGETTDLPNANTGSGWVMAGDNAEYASIRFASDGSVAVFDETANVATSDTANKLCIFDNGTSVRIKNNLGSSQIIRLFIQCSGNS